MNNRFWFITLPAGPDAARCALFGASAMASSGRTPAVVAVEIIRRLSSWIVLVSVADRPDSSQFECVFGISDNPDRCDELAHFGLPVIEGEVVLERDTFQVSIPAFPSIETEAAVHPEPRCVLRVYGIVNDIGVVAGESSTRVSYMYHLPYMYHQRIATPDIARPESELVGQFCDSAPTRRVESGPQSPSATQTIEFVDNVRYPDLARLLPRSAVPVTALWSGAVGKWGSMGNGRSVADGSAPAPLRFAQRSPFGAPAFIFDDLELVGFRVELPSRDVLDRLIAPLNFHRTSDQEPIDFVYSAATSTLVIELLRYGKMRTRDASPPLLASDFMCQHELLVRVLVGRVDDDTSQARAAASFVPVIFVDNPWSRALGRRLLGFPKTLAEFRTKEGALDMTGRLKDASARLRPLSAISEVHAIGKPNTRLLVLDCPDADAVDDRDFTSPPAFLASTVFRRSPFEQLDFDAVEFRRSFARDLLANGFDTLRTVQVSPVDGLPLPKAWIAGRCILKNVTAAFPTGVATLRLHNLPSAPRTWRRLCRTLNDRAETLAFPSGDWYRLRGSMEITIDDGLAW